MDRYVAFLRGINLGGRRPKMAELRSHFEELGFENVATYIASGNVVFDLPDPDPEGLEARIERHLEGALGYEVDTFIRSLERLREIAGLDAIEEAREEGFTPHVIFLRDRADDAMVQGMESIQTPDDRFPVLERGREVLWLRRGGLSETTIDQRDLGRALGGASVTMRNANTVQRIVAKFGE